MGPSSDERGRYATVALLAVLYTLLNVPKPLQVDDAAYYYFAQQFARDPAHPYAFDIFWYDQPYPANSVLAPPGLPAWWSLIYRVAPDNPWLWKLWLLPFSLLLVGALDALLRRFCRGVALPLLFMTVLSPALLPSLNLMLDVPALALSLTSVVVFLAAVDRPTAAGWRGLLLPPASAWGLAAVAGVVAGLAMQTKYTGVVAPAAMILAGVFFRRPTLPILSGLIASAIFVGWELFVMQQHGQSHFYANLPGPDPEYWDHKLLFVFLLAPYLGGTAQAVILLGLVALRLRRTALIVGVLLAVGFAAVAALPPTWFVDTVGELPALTLPWDKGNQMYVFVPTGWLLGAVALAVAAQLCFPWRLTEEGLFWRVRFGSANSWFLVSWLLLEIAAYVALTPFGAVRRILGIVVAATLCLGHLASLTCRSPGSRLAVNLVAGFGAFLGLLYYKVDLDDAFAGKDAAEAAARVIHDADAHPSVWFVGHWGFQFYAERAGMQPVQPNHTLLREGDWLVVPSEPVHQQPLEIDPACTEHYRTLAVPAGIPLRCVMTFYGGFHPIEPFAGPRLTVSVYRVTATHRARRPPS